MTTTQQSVKLQNTSIDSETLLTAFPLFMKNHIILCAFGTTTSAKEIYKRFEKLLAPRFPDCRIHWTFSSPAVLRAARLDPPASLSEIVAALPSPEKVVVQSLHILPGYEFHRTVVETRTLPFPAAIGRPLLDRPQDFVRSASALKHLFDNSGSDTALVLGHGTDHPCRYLFVQLEQELRSQCGDRVIFTTIEKALRPPERIIESVTATGCKKLFCIPFLMVAGMHFFKDIIGDSDDSWRSRFRQHHIELNAHDQGIALLDETVSIFGDHIEDAFAYLENST